MNNQDWLKNVLVQKKGEGVLVSTEPAVTTSVIPETVNLDFDDALRRAILMERED